MPSPAAPVPASAPTSTAAVPALQSIAVLGMGRMGLPMARRLCQAGHTVHVWNRTRAKAEVLAADGATVHGSAADAARQADVLLSLLENGPAVAQVLFGAGVASDFERAQSVFAALGRATPVGPHGAGQLAKLANQMVVGITIGAVAEALLFAARGGADMAKVREAILGGFADSRVLQLHGQRMVERDFAPRARMGVQLKDLNNALTTAKQLGFEAPVTALLGTLYREGIENGLNDLDHSGLFVELARRNGME